MCWRRHSLPFDTARVLAVNLPVMTYGRTPEQVQDFYREVQRRVSALPGVAHVSTGFSVPWRDDQALNISFAFAAQGAARKNGLDDWRAKFRSVSPGYFETLGLPIWCRGAISGTRTRTARNAW